MDFEAVLLMMLNELMCTVYVCSVDVGYHGPLACVCVLSFFVFFVFVVFVVLCVCVCTCACACACVHAGQSIPSSFCHEDA